MIVERLTFQAKFGQGDTIVKAFQEWRETFGAHYGVEQRLLVDLTGQMFTVTAETQYRDMAQVTEMEEALATAYADPEWQRWFGSWQNAVETGKRELFRVVE